MPNKYHPIEYVAKLAQRPIDPAVIADFAQEDLVFQKSVIFNCAHWAYQALVHKEETSKEAHALASLVGSTATAPFITRILLRLYQFASLNDNADYLHKAILQMCQNRTPVDRQIITALEVLSDFFSKPKLINELSEELDSKDNSQHDDEWKNMMQEKFRVTVMGLALQRLWQIDFLEKVIEQNSLPQAREITQSVIDELLYKDLELIKDLNLTLRKKILNQQMNVLKTFISSPKLKAVLNIPSEQEYFDKIVSMFTEQKADYELLLNCAKAGGWITEQQRLEYQAKANQHPATAVPHHPSPVLSNSGNDPASMPAQPLPGNEIKFVK